MKSLPQGSVFLALWSKCRWSGRMAMCVCSLAVSLIQIGEPDIAMAEEQKPSPPAAVPMSNEQLLKVRAILLRTKGEQTELRSRLSELQAELAGCYMKFELDNSLIEHLHEGIVIAQRKLMDSHHAMHAEIRVIVGADRFKALVGRIDWYVKGEATDKVRKPGEKSVGQPSVQASSESSASSETRN